MVVPQSKPSRTTRLFGAFERSSPDALPGRNDQPSGDVAEKLDEATTLGSLKDLIAGGDHRLETMLATITDTARQLTGASGAALAMWKEGAMVCRARSGDPAPPIGARLNADAGISGECLRTAKVQHCSDTENNPFVDVEVCRSLGLRSMVVLPIQGWRGVNGILEVLSTQPSAFSEEHIATLQQLAALAERARATRPHGASPAPPKLASAIEKPQSGLLPASDRVGDVALAFVDHRSRPFVLGGIGLLALSLLAFVIWLGWRGPDDSNSKAHAAVPETMNHAVDAPPAVRPAAVHSADGDPVWKENPGGESLFTSSGKPSAGAPVTFASKVDVISRKTAAPSLMGDVADKVAANVSIPHRTPDAPTRDAPTDEPALTEPPAISGERAGKSELSGVLSANAALPSLSAPVSGGVSGGELVRRVQPVYPAQALTLRLEGAVMLEATVAENGTVREIRVVDGSPVLAPSAVDAVKRWRYKPFELDGKPVAYAIQITIDFKLPKNN